MSKKHIIKALIYNKKGRILSIGENCYLKTHPLQKKMAIAAGQPERIYLHAEIAALVKLKNWEKVFRIVITRFTADGKPANAKPCPCCMNLLNKLGVVIEHT